MDLIMFQVSSGCSTNTGAVWLLQLTFIAWCLGPGSCSNCAYLHHVLVLAKEVIESHTNDVGIVNFSTTAYVRQYRKVAYV